MFARVSVKTWRVALYACAFAVLVLATMPVQESMPSTGWDKTDHLAAFIVLGLLGQRAYPATRAACQLGLLGFGAGIEVLQSALPHREGAWLDLLADAAGLALALGVSTLWFSTFGRPIRP
jgi:VanZ family protein